MRPTPAQRINGDASPVETVRLPVTFATGVDLAYGSKVNSLWPPKMMEDACCSRKDQTKLQLTLSVIPIR